MTYETKNPQVHLPVGQFFNIDLNDKIYSFFT